MDEDEIYTLDETIQNFYNLGALMSENDLQMLAWLEELQDLRNILKSSAATNDEDGFEDIDNAIEWIEDEWNATGETGPEQYLFWLKQLRKAQERAGDDTHDDDK